MKWLASDCLGIVAGGTAVGQLAKPEVVAEAVAQATAATATAIVAMDWRVVVEL